MNVLVVDQETFLAELVKLALEADGHACFTAASVLAASEMLRSIHFDLIVVDLATDDPNSLAWLEETILGHPELRERAFVFAGGALESTEARRVWAFGARVIQKPFTFHQLRDAVRTMAPVVGKKAGPHTRGPAIETS
jgi:DNA-binding response OmpR family regulator